MRSLKPEEREQREIELELPLPGEKPEPKVLQTAEQVDDDGAQFLALMNENFH